MFPTDILSQGAQTFIVTFTVFLLALVMLWRELGGFRGKLDLKLSDRTILKFADAIADTFADRGIGCRPEEGGEELKWACRYAENIPALDAILNDEDFEGWCVENIFPSGSAKGNNGFYVVLSIPADRFAEWADDEPAAEAPETLPTPTAGILSAEEHAAMRQPIVPDPVTPALEVITGGNPLAGGRFA